MDSRLNKAFEAAASTKKVPAIAGIAMDRSGKTLWKGAFGTTNLDDPSAPKYTSSTPTIIWSCTKLVASIAALQLIEQGKLALDDPVEKYVPGIKDVQVLDGWNDDGSPKFRAPKTKATILHLFTHTAGFSYDFFHGPTMQYRLYMKEEPAQYLGGKKYILSTPMFYDPGERHTYGINIDYLGFVVEAISGLRLDKYIEANILKPLGMKNTGATVEGGYAGKGLAVHHRGEDGSLTANAAFVTPDECEFYGGGHYLLSTLDDYSTFLLTLLNNGTHPDSKAQILKEETVKEYVFKDQMHKICPSNGVGVIGTVVPALSVEGEFLPGLEKGWSCGLMMNKGSLKGRSDGSGSWAGLGNLYYWLDPKEGKMGLVMSAILPFMDAEVLHLFDELERAVYGHEASLKAGEVGSNYGLGAVAA